MAGGRALEIYFEVSLGLLWAIRKEERPFSPGACFAIIERCIFWDLGLHCRLESAIINVQPIRQCADFDQIKI